MNFLKYFISLVIPISIYIALQSHGWFTFMAVFVAFGLIPLLEVWIKPNSHNLEKTIEEQIKKDQRYDLVLYLASFLQFGFLYLFLQRMSVENSILETIGLVFSFGISCGVMGINVAHEWGHRSSKFHQLLAKLLLMTSLYMHFFIEHNRGHHLRVATEHDPASARLGESIYLFWPRSVIMSYLSAWKLENNRLKKQGKAPLSIRNEMMVFHIIQFLFLGLIASLFSVQIMIYFCLSAITGFLLLETVNYVEHYGLRRSINKKGRPEKVQVWHSWNSDHVLGRFVLFELTRHSDHHYNAGRHYQILRHHDKAPQLPTGYPGMMMLSLIPPLWFAMMNKRIK